VTDIGCVEVVELVTDYVDRALDAETMRRFNDHLPGCQGCQRYAEQIRQTLELLRHHLDPCVPPAEQGGGQGERLIAPSPTGSARR
jgi:anti-sigma factor RsiW